MINTSRTKDKILLAIISLFVILTIFIIFIPLIFGFIKNKPFLITYDNKIINNSITISDLELKPGVVKTTDTNFKCLVSGRYKVKFIVTEKDASMLCEYLEVDIKYDNKSLYNGLLSDAYNDFDIYIVDNFEKGNDYIFVLTYILPEDVGNEIQGENVSFMIEIVIEQENEYEK